MPTANELIKNNNGERAKVKFKVSALLKMNALVKHYTTEVAWHCLVDRIAGSEFIVEDVLVFPQANTAASTRTDQEEYQAWLEKLWESGELRCRLYAHSHVNMGVSPSGFDAEKMDATIKNIGGARDDYDNFYMFMIMNKRNDMFIAIFDNQNNIAYGNSLIDTEVVFDDGTPMDEYLKDACQIIESSVLNHKQDNTQNEEKKECQLTFQNQ